MTVATAEEAAARIWNTEGPSARALGILLGVRPGERSLFIGARAHPDWMGFIPQLDPGAVYADLKDFLSAQPAPRGPFDLVVVAAGREAQALECTLGRVKGLLGHQGTLLLVVPNRTSLQGFRRNPTQPLQPGRRTSRGYRSLLAQAGFSSNPEFLYTPWGQGSFELLASDQRPQLPAYAPRLERALNHAGALARLHDTYAYLAWSGRAGVGRLLCTLAEQLKERGAAAPPELRLTRVAVRSRGALILFFRDVRTGRRILCRLPISPQARPAVAQNLRWTRAIHTDPRIPAHLRDLVPAPLGEVEVGDATAYLETLVPGTIAWKVAVRPRVETSLFPQACAFLSALSAATRECRSLGEEEIEALLPLPRRPWLEREFAGLLSNLRDALVGRVVDEARRLCLTHGDFGYGNVMASTRGGILTGVIDWDRARMDLEGVDLVNFLVQRRRMQGQVSLSEAVAEVGRLVIDQGAAALPVAAVDPLPLPADRAQRQEAMAWAIWRFVERDTTYAHEYERGRQELAACLRWAIAELAV